MSNLRAPLLHSTNVDHYAKWPWGLPFPMVKISAATVVWSNPRLRFEGGEKALLEEFAWNIPLGEKQRSHDLPTKTFYAECYGGDGIHYNGGGVRCAWSGNWLVKGIGINLLSGYSDEDAAEYRKNGRASISEMLVEAIWGEVLHEALPYGAARMTAIIKTGETLADANQPAGTGIREFAWRPAQFMRAYAFHVRPENRASIPSDTARVKDAIACLPQMLPMPLALSEPELAKLEPLERLKIGLEEMVRRFAEQLAAAKAKRLSHGTLSPSNVCLDGRWNDLNSVSALPGYGYRRNMAPFWIDQLSLNKTIDLLCFYIGKYFPAVSQKNFEAMPTTAWLSELYLRHYNDALARRFVAICGYPQIVANRVWAHPAGKIAMRELSAQLIAFARSGHSPRRPYDDEMQENTVSGNYDLPEILRWMIRSGARSDARFAIENLVIDLEIREAFILRYRIVAMMMFSEADKLEVSEKAFTRLVAVNCNKARRVIPFLFRNVIFQRCRELTENYKDITELQCRAGLVIEKVIDEARVVYQEPKNFKTLLWCAGKNTIEYDANADVLVADIAGEKSELLCVLPPAHKDLPDEFSCELLAMHEYWGSVYEEMML